MYVIMCVITFRIYGNEDDIYLNFIIS